MERSPLHALDGFTRPVAFFQVGAGGVFPGRVLLPGGGIIMCVLLACSGYQLHLHRLRPAALCGWCIQCNNRETNSEL